MTHDCNLHLLYLALHKSVEVLPGDLGTRNSYKGSMPASSAPRLSGGAYISQTSMCSGFFFVFQEQ